jgi:hypothetical protein
MSRAARHLDHVQLEWFVEPPAAFLNHSFSGPQILLRFTLPEYWDPNDSLLFTANFRSLEPWLSTSQPESQFPWPYNEFHGSGFSFVGSTDIRSGCNLVSFADIDFATKPGIYRLDIFAFAVTLYPGGARNQVGRISSKPIRFCTTREEMEDWIEVQSRQYNR